MTAIPNPADPADLVRLVLSVYGAGALVATLAMFAAHRAGTLEIEREIGIFPVWLIVALVIFFWPVAFLFAISEP